MKRLPRLTGIRRLGMGSGGGGVAPIIWTFRDTFATPEASPIASPRTCEPGPGTWTVTQTAGTIAVNASGQLEITGNNEVDKTSLYSVAAYNTIPGMVLIFDRIAGLNNCWIGFSRANGWTGSSAFAIQFESGSTRIYNGLRAIGNGTSYAIVQQPTSRKVLAKISDVWKLVFDFPVAPLADYHISIQQYKNAKNIFDNVGLYVLAAPWTTDLGIATFSIATPIADAVYNGSADGYNRVTWTPGAGETLEIMFRRTDDDNCWILRCAQAAGTVKLYEKTAGIETERDPGKTQTFTVGTAYRIEFVTDGVVIRSHTGTTFTALKNNYTSGGFNQAATGIKISGFATAANLVCYPRNVPNF